MSRKPLGPPPDWIATEAAEQAAGPDPLRSIFSEARATRSAEAEDDKGIYSMVQERALHLTPEQVSNEIKRRLREIKETDSFFTGVIVTPSFTADVPDSRDARLVILGPNHTHSSEGSDSQARRTAATLLDHRGAGPRTYRNTLVFCAPEQMKIGELQLAVRSNLGWRSVVADARELRLDSDQVAQADLGLHRSDAQVTRVITECYRWLLVPTQTDPSQPVTWREMEMESSGELAIDAGLRLEMEGLLFTQIEGDRLRLELERLRTSLGERAAMGQLADHFARYLFLPRLTNMRVLQDAIQSGLNTGDSLRMLGQAAAAKPASTGSARVVKRKRRFTAEFGLDPLHFSRDANAVHIAVVQHLLALSAAGVKLTLKVEAQVPENSPEDVIKTITDNCSSLSSLNAKLEMDGS
jgi:hypothetical protein